MDDDVEPDNVPEQMLTEPPQHPDVRRRIRIQYRTLLNDVSSKRSELLSGNTVVLKEKIDDTNEIFENVKHPREAALDAQCCASIAHLGKQKAQALSTGFGSFSIAEFVDKLVARVGRNVDEDNDRGSRGPAISRDGWIRLGTASQTFFRRTPTLHYMYGMLDREERVRMKPQRTDKNEEERNEQMKAAVKPKQLEKFSESEEVTTREVESALVILRKTYKENSQCPICYFEFVTNPKSFSQTIENVFYTSFLIRDGFARIFLDDDGLPVIEPVMGPAAGESENGDDDDDDDECHQMVMAWTLQDWKDVINSFQIKESIIPTREHSKKPSSTGFAVPLTSPSAQMNGVASSSERARASSASAAQAVNSAGKSSTARSSTLLTPAQAGPSGMTKTVNGSAASRSANTSSLSTPRRASRKSYVFDDSDDMTHKSDVEKPADAGKH